MDRLIIEAKKIMGDNFIGPDELQETSFLLFESDRKLPYMPFSLEELKVKKEDYLLILGTGKMKNGKDVNIRNLCSYFGKNPDVSEPCFYNQDWYECESFIDVKMQDKWFLIRKNVYEESRAVQPLELMRKFVFPTAIDCAYTFFVSWFVKDIKLWDHDFVWCKDVDHNGDRIYVGKYYDIDGVNKNGFSIHRHLGLRSCYACID
ncbi:hypothetical protein NXH76_23225 [Blautia schinkii]|nr:hypothetical protein [Blautia schinkii]